MPGITGALAALLAGGLQVPAGAESGTSSICREWCLDLITSQGGVWNIEECAEAEVAYVFQDRPIEEPPHTAPERFAGAVTEFRLPVVPLEDGPKVYAAIVSDFPEPTGFPRVRMGVVGWSMNVGSSSCVRFLDVTTEGTAAAPEPEGLMRAGFEEIDVEDCPPGVLYSKVLDLIRPLTLPPQGTATVLSFRVTPREEPAESKLEAPLIWGGVWSSGQPVARNVVTVAGSSRDACAVHARVDFVPAFRRGDTNSDGRVDITDAIRIFRWLYAGAAPPSCLDAADTNDDGYVWITDGILILRDFFREGTAIAPPGPFRCGMDPTEDEISCHAYDVCP